MSLASTTATTPTSSSSSSSSAYYDYNHNYNSNHHDNHLTTYSYLDIHLYFTLPLLCSLYFISRPFLHPLAKTKLYILSLLAFVYTTPWDNYILSNQAWSYCPNCIQFTMGFVPMEEYLFFLIQTWISGLIAILVFQWPFSFNNNASSFPYSPTHLLLHTLPNMERIRFMGCFSFLTLALLAFVFSSPYSPSFYFTSIVWWSFPILALQWYCAGHFIVALLYPSLFAILIPTIILSLIDAFALQHHIWSISSHSIFKWYLLQDFPFEEGFFFLITNTMLVFGMIACDRTFAIMKLHNVLYIPSSRHSLSFYWSYLKCALQCTFESERHLNALHLNDLLLFSKTIKKGSRSFFFASFFFPWDLRQDIHTIYSFCRVTDDIADNESIPHSIRQNQLHSILHWLQSYLESMENEKKNHPIDGSNMEKEKKKHLTYSTSSLFNSLPNCSYPTWTTLPFTSIPPKESLDWKWTETQLAAFRGVSYLLSNAIFPLQPIQQLFKGYFWDLNQSNIHTLSDLIQYSTYVASTVGEMMTYLMFSPTSTPPRPFILTHASDFGIAMQLTNIARDIITDAKLNRCYLPSEWISTSYTASDFQRFFSNLSTHSTTTTTTTTSSSSVGPKNNRSPQEEAFLKVMADRLICLAQSYQEKGEQGIASLPSSYRIPVKLASRIYSEIGNVIQSSSTYPERAVVSKFKFVSLLFYICYFEEPMSYLRSLFFFNSSSSA